MDLGNVRERKHEQYPILSPSIRPSHSTLVRRRRKTITSLPANSRLIRCLVPGPPREGQLICTLFLSMRHTPSKTNDVILPHEENHGITLRCSKRVLILITQILQWQGTPTQ